MPQQDTFRSTPQRKPGPPATRPQQRQQTPRLTPQEMLERELTFSVSLQLLRESVEHGWKVSFTEFDGDVVTGYLAGIDREYFVLAIPDPSYTERDDHPHHGYWLRGVSRSMNTGFIVHFDDENTFEGELAYPKMAPRVAACRDWMVRSMSKSPSGPAKQGPPQTGKPYRGDVHRSWQKQPGTEAVGPSHPHFSEARRA